MRKLNSLILICCLPIFVSAQRVDSIPKQKGVQLKSFIVPAIFVGYGLVSTGDNFLNRFDRSIQKRIHTDHLKPSEIPEDILRYVPAMAVYGLNFSGVKGKNSLIDASGIYILSTAIMGVTVNSTKGLAERVRPDASNNRSFPSGHSATAFASAEFLKQEYKDISPLYGYAGYTIATATGVLRLRHNKHWFGDVVAGAGFGIISTKTAYLLYPEVKKVFVGNSKREFSLLPSYQDRALGLNFNAKF